MSDRLINAKLPMASPFVVQAVRYDTRELMLEYPDHFKIVGFTPLALDKAGKERLLDQFEAMPANIEKAAEQAAFEADGIEYRVQLKGNLGVVVYTKGTVKPKGATLQ